MMVIEAGIQRVEISSMETDVITRRPPLTKRAAILGMCLAIVAATACSNSGPTGVACIQV